MTSAGGKGFRAPEVYPRVSSSGVDLHVPVSVTVMSKTIVGCALAMKVLGKLATPVFARSAGCRGQRTAVAVEAQGSAHA